MPARRAGLDAFVTESRAAWARFMAVFCYAHPFPNGNHRTAVYAFNYYLHHRFGKIVVMAKERARDVLEQSKAERLEERREGDEVEAVVAPDHPYHALFLDGARHLELADLENARLEL